MPCSHKSMTGVSDHRLRMERLGELRAQVDQMPSWSVGGHRMDQCGVWVGQPHRDSAEFLTYRRDFLLWTHRSPLGNGTNALLAYPCERIYLRTSSPSGEWPFGGPVSRWYVTACASQPVQSAYLQHPQLLDEALCSVASFSHLTSAD